MRTLAVAGAAIGVALTAAACGGGGHAAASATASASPAATASPAGSTGGGSTVAGSGGALKVSLATIASVGPVLVDPSGRTVYVLLSASGATLPCTGGCLGIWPAVQVASVPAAGAGVSATLGDSGGQLTVDGRPVYTFRGDSAAGQASGEGIHSFGGIWYALSASGAPVTAGASAHSSYSSGGGGYGSGY